jgi:hypothetical protein
MIMCSREWFSSIIMREFFFFFIDNHYEGIEEPMEGGSCGIDEAF